MRIIVINLDHDTDRRARVGRRLAELGLRWERLSAVDGRRLDSRHQRLIDHDTNAARGLEFSPGAIGCWLSHREAQRMVAEGAEPMALILEDDIAIADDLPNVLERIERGDAGRFDVIRLHRYKMHRKFVPARRIGDGTLGFVRPVDSGAQAYVITREAAGRLVASIPRMVQLADHALYEHWTHGLVVCSIDPPVFATTTGAGPRSRRVLCAARHRCVQCSGCGASGTRSTRRSSGGVPGAGCCACTRRPAASRRCERTPAFRPHRESRSHLAR